MVGGTSSCGDRGRHPATVLDPELAVVDQHRQQLLEEQRVAPRPSTIRARDARRRRRRRARRRRRWASSLVNGSSTTRSAGPGRPSPDALEQLVTRRAEKITTDPSSCSASWPIRSRNVGSAQWMSSNNHTSGSSPAEPLEQRAGHPAPAPSTPERRGRETTASPGERPPGSPTTPASLASADVGGVLRPRSLPRLARPRQRPEGDAFAVRKASTAHDRNRLSPGRESSSMQAALADAGVADDGHQPGLALTSASSNTVRSGRELALAADHRRGCRRRRSAPGWTATRRWAGTGSALPLSVSGSTASR